MNNKLLSIVTQLIILSSLLYGYIAINDTNKINYVLWIVFYFYELYVLWHIKRKLSLYIVSFLFCLLSLVTAIAISLYYDNSHLSSGLLSMGVTFPVLLLSLPFTLVVMVCTMVYQYGTGNYLRKAPPINTMLMNRDLANNNSHKRTKVLLPHKRKITPPVR